jgi:hypothetical protein
MLLRSRVLWPAACFALVCLLSFAGTEARARGKSAAPYKEVDFLSSEHCAECHTDIHDGWKSSIHATSLKDPLVQEAMQTAAARLGPDGRRLCLACHAPVALSTGDDALASPLSWEGVSCDFCHSIASVQPGDPLACYRLEPGNVRRGPIRDASSTDHEVAYSGLFTESELCAGCHEYRPQEGEPVLTTYSEWQASPYSREGITCQSCHMKLVRANVVDPKVKRISSSTVNLHIMPGGHSLDQLLTAARVGVEASRAGDSLRVQVRIANAGAGHALPTGFPSRRIVLEVEVGLGNARLRDTRTYARTLLDKAGREIVRDDEVMIRPAAQVTDTRLKPGEERLEQFSFPVPAAVDASMAVRLHYVHLPLGQEAATDQVFYSERKFMKGR